MYCPHSAAGIRMLREIDERPAFRGLWEAEVLPGPQASTDAELLEFARRHGGTVFHCVDASVMPVVTSANTNAASLMIGEKGARLIAGGAGKAP